MNNEYVIVNKSLIEKRIEELEKANEIFKNAKTHNPTMAACEATLSTLKQILSQSTPLIPVLEQAFESGVDSLQDNLIQKLGLSYQTSEVSSTTINSTRGNLEEYISNLKLDI